jgi:hypothetical protein
MTPIRLASQRCALAGSGGSPAKSSRNGSLAPARQVVWRAGSGGSFEQPDEQSGKEVKTQMPAKKKAKKAKKAKKK